MTNNRSACRTAGVQLTLVLCVVYGCSKHSDRDIEMFPSSGSPNSSLGRVKNYLAPVKEKRWISSYYIQSGTDREDTEEWYRICSRHFISGKLAEVLDVTTVVQTGYHHRTWARSGPLLLLLLLQKDRQLERCKLVSEKLHNTQVCKLSMLLCLKLNLLRLFVLMMDLLLALERVIGNVRQKYSILHSTLPILNAISSALCNVCK